MSDEKEEGANQFRRIIADPKETAINQGSDPDAPEGTAINAETGLPVEGSMRDIHLKGDEEKLFQGDSDLGFSGAEKKPGAGRTGLTAESDKEPDISGLSFSADSDLNHADVKLSGYAETKGDSLSLKGGQAPQGEASSLHFEGATPPAEGGDISLQAGPGQENTQVSFSADSVLEHQTRLYKEAEQINEEISLIAKEIRETGKQVEETVAEVEQVSKASKLPERLASRLENIRKGTDGIKKSTFDLEAKRKALKKWRKS